MLASQVFSIQSGTMRFARFANRLYNFYHRLQAELEEAREEARIKAQEEIVVRIQEAKVISNCHIRRFFFPNSPFQELICVCFCRAGGRSTGTVATKGTVRGTSHTSP